ncbi:MAG: phenylacetate--CoA ligase family protein [Myxococcota bacterium]
MSLRSALAVAPDWAEVSPGQSSGAPPNAAPYWDRTRETASPAVRDALILQRLRHMLTYVYDRPPFYRRLYDKHGLTRQSLAGLSSFDEFTQRIPIITKAMLLEAQRREPPLGDYLAVERNRIQRLQGTSGTTRQPTLLAFTAEDWRHVAEAQAMQMWGAGLRPSDIVQIAFPLGLYVGGWGLLSAAEYLGATVLPLAGASSRRQLAFMRQTRSTVLCATPSYALRLIEVARAAGFDPAQSSWRLIFLGGEPGAAIPAVRGRIESELGVRAVDFGNVAELHPCSNMECSEGCGMHVYQDVVYTEIVDPEQPSVRRPPDHTGALVYTHLWRQAQPMIRYFSGDLSVMTDAPCRCGRTYPRLPRGVIGRIDDQINLRGVKFFPSDVEHVVRAVPGAGTEFQMRRIDTGGAPELEVRVEAAAAVEPARYATLQTELVDALQDDLAVRLAVSVVPPQTLPRGAFKAQRLVRTSPPPVHRSAIR